LDLCFVLGTTFGACHVELISDITFNAIFPEKEILKERDVILDELNAYLDSPADSIFDEFEERLFAGHPLSGNILGNNLRCPV